MLKSRWASLRPGALTTSNVTGLVQSTADYLTRTGAVERNYEKWSSISISYDSEINDMISLEERLAWMDSEVNSL